MGTGQLRRGFVKEAEAIAVELRAELRLSVHDRLDCRQLAAHLDVEIAPLSTFDCAGAAYFLSDAGTDDFSAMTIQIRTRRHIVLNDRHSPVRQASSLAHELGHIILGHQHVPPLTGDGTREFDAVIEDEASRLGGALLVPKDAAITIARSAIDNYAHAERLGVSVQLLQYRLRLSGANNIAKRAGARR